MTLEARLAAAFLAEHPANAAAVLERLPLEARVAALAGASDAAGPALRALPGALASETLAALPAGEAAAALVALRIDEAVALLRRLPPGVAERLIGEVPAARQEAIRRPLRFPSGTAGALMDSDVSGLPDELTVAEARVRLRRAPRGFLYYLYMVDREGRLAGVLDLQELMRADARATLGAAMRRPVERLTASTPAAVVRVHPGWGAFHAMPVTDDEGHLVGAIRYQTWRRLEMESAAGHSAAPVGPTVIALGELFHLGLAGFVEGVAAVSGPRVASSSPVPVEEAGTTADRKAR